MTNGLTVAGVWVGTTAGEAVGGSPPNGVGVTYCPHKDAFPVQEASKKEAAIKKLISRFTKKSAEELYLYKEPESEVSELRNKIERVCIPN